MSSVTETEPTIVSGGERAFTRLPGEFRPAAREASAPRKVRRIVFVVRATDGSAEMRVIDDPAQTRPLPVGRLVTSASATFVLLLVVGLLAMSSVPRLLGYEPVVVTSGSMTPAIGRGDVVVTTPTDGRMLSEGTVVNFESDDGTVLHRIIEDVDGRYRTKGDANRNADSVLVAPEDVRGIGTLVVPFAGIANLWVKDGQWVHLVVAVIMTLGAVFVSRSAWVDGRSESWV